MQLSSLSKIDGKPSMTVDYYPIQDSSQFVYKVLKFQGVDTMSSKCITQKDYQREMNERIGLGWVVTNSNNDSVAVNPMNGAC